MKIKRHACHFVYILRCGDKTFYTGYTPDLQRRVKLHRAGRGAKYTRGRGPLRLVWFREYRYFKHAFREERRIKRLPKKRKEKLIAAFRKKNRTR